MVLKMEFVAMTTTKQSILQTHVHILFSFWHRVKIE